MAGVRMMLRSLALASIIFCFELAAGLGLGLIGVEAGQHHQARHPGDHGDDVQAAGKIVTVECHETLAVRGHLVKARGQMRAPASQEMRAGARASRFTSSASKAM